MKEKKLNIAVVPGSFDPITYGHIDIVQRAAESYDKVYLAVMINSEKRYMFTMEERVKIAKAAVCHLSNVEVISSEGMLWKLTKDLSASAIVKGYRNDKDLVYELEMAEYNKRNYPKAETVLLKSKEALEGISSTAVRNIIQSGGSLQGFLPNEAIKLIENILKNK